jgi:hypothetical protein
MGLAWSSERVLRRPDARDGADPNPLTFMVDAEELTYGSGLPPGLAPNTDNNTRYVRVDSGQSRAQ